MPIFFTVFSVPSTYAHAGITAPDVEAARTAICRRGVTSITTLEALKANFELLEQPVNKRLSRLQLVLAGLWGFLGFWFWNLFLPGRGSTWVGSFAQFMISSAALLIIFLIIQGYTKAHSKLFSIIYIAINELRVLNHAQT